MGKETFKEDAVHYWGIVGLYMHTRAGLAQCLLVIGRRDEAVVHYTGLFWRNPDSKQGILDLLMPCLIAIHMIKRPIICLRGTKMTVARLDLEPD